MTHDQSMREALQQVCADFHVGALIKAIDTAARTTPGRLPSTVTQLALVAHEVLRSLKLDDPDGPHGRIVWRSGVDVHDVPSRLQVERWAAELTLRAFQRGEYATVQHLLTTELVTDPGALAELVGYLAADAVGRTGT